MLKISAIILVILTLSYPIICFADNGIEKFDSTGSISKSSGLLNVKLPSFLQTPEKIEAWRCGVYGALLVSATYYAFTNMDEVWGQSSGDFHYKNHDWNDDRLAFTDEVSHMLVSYKLTQACKGLFSWCGFSPRISRICGASGAAIWMTAVEYPIDAYNPKQGFGWSDMVFNFMGISFATLRDRYPWAYRFDLKLSLESLDYFANTIVAMTLEENNNYIYWLTYQPYREKLPFHVGFGYSGKMADTGKREAAPQGFIGVGISLSDLTPILGKDWGKFLGNFGFYSFSLYVEIF
ncbi:DUF2279 domain-containing protein [bacterium]|nr:DUF2279 domain-containing protein [bacterium]